METFFTECGVSLLAARILLIFILGTTLCIACHMIKKSVVKGVGEEIYHA